METTEQKSPFVQVSKSTIVIGTDDWIELVRISIEMKEDLKEVHKNILHRYVMDAVSRWESYLASIVEYEADKYKEKV